MPANAGIHGMQRTLAGMDPGIRRDDDGVDVDHWLSACPLLK